MMNLFSLERETEVSLLAKALCKDGFAFAVTDTRETLLWNYLGKVREQLPSDEQALLEDPVFEVLYLTRREELEQMLQEKGIYFSDETSRILLLLVINYANNGCELSLRYFASNATPDAIASFLAWEGMMYATACDLLRHYPGERTEEILLTLETYGLEGVLNQVVPTDILKKVFDYCLLEERVTLRRTCRALATYNAPHHPMFEGQFTSLFQPMSLKMMRNLGVNSQFLLEMHFGRLSDYSSSGIGNLRRFHFLVKLLIADQDPRAENLLLAFVREYLTHQKSVCRDAKRRTLAKCRVEELALILRRGEGLKPTPVLMRCLALTAEEL